MPLPQFRAEIPEISPLVAAATARANGYFQQAGAFGDRLKQYGSPPQQEGSLFAAQGTNGGMPPTVPSSGTPVSDDLSQFGLASNVPRSLIHTESGGNWNADNKLGYHGFLQFGPERFADAQRAGVVPAGMTLQQFGTAENKSAQIAAANWHFSDIDQRIKANGLDRYLGQTIGGVPITMNGLRAMAHLGGFGGMQKFLTTGGSYNPSDAFGTSLAAYGRTHLS